MSAAEASLKEKMARLKAKREADAAAKAGGGGAAGVGAAGIPVAIHGARIAPTSGATAAAAPGSTARPAGRAAPLVGTPVPIKAPPRPGSSSSSTAARPTPSSASSTAQPSRPAAQAPRPTAMGAGASSLVVPVPAPAAAAVLKRRIPKKAVQAGDAGTASAAAAAAAVPSPAAPAPAAPSGGGGGVKRKKHSAPAPIVQLVSNADAEALSKKPRVSLANTDHLGGFSRDNTRFNNSFEGGVRRPTAEEKCTLWIENLAEGVTGDDLRPLLTPFGHLEEVKIGPGKSYGTIRFRSRDAASMVLEQVHDSMMAGSAVQISWYLPRERGVLPPTAPASTSQTDLDRYHQAAAVPTTFAALLRDYKPLVAARPRLAPDAARHIEARVQPSTTMGHVGVMTRSAARAQADATPLPQLPTDLPPRELVPYDLHEY